MVMRASAVFGFVNDLISFVASPLTPSMKLQSPSIDNPGGHDLVGGAGLEPAAPSV
jgi:hypothetical protein